MTLHACTVALSLSLSISLPPLSLTFIIFSLNNSKEITLISNNNESVHSAIVSNKVRPY